MPEFFRKTDPVRSAFKHNQEKKFRPADRAIYRRVIDTARLRISTRSTPVECLDVGAGRGELLEMLVETMDLVPHACDYHIERFTLDSVPIDKVDLNTAPLPYADNTFDLVTCSEVVEHIENYRATFREIFRVLKPQGLAIFTSPNVINMKSRVRFFATGFFNLFGPLPVRNNRITSTGGHITPIPAFYLGHGLLDAGFSDLHFETDKVQQTSLLWLILAFPMVATGWIFFLHQEKRRSTLTETNRPLVNMHARLALLLGRTVIVSARK